MNMTDWTNINKEAFNDPKPGDFWHEMFCPYFVVLANHGDELIICEYGKPMPGNHWTWDLTKAKAVPKSYMECVKYQSIEGFVADVSRTQYWAVEAWKDLGSPIMEEPKGPIASDFRTVMDQGI